MRGKRGEMSGLETLISSRGKRSIRGMANVQVTRPKGDAMSPQLAAPMSLTRETSAEPEPIDAREALDDALISRVADYGLGLTVAIVDEGTTLRVLSRDGSYDESRPIAAD